jgi:hypothetical protein
VPVTAQAALFDASHARAPARRRAAASAPAPKRRPAPVDLGPRVHDVPGASMAREMRAFATWLRTATADELVELDAAHRAAGYGGEVVDDGGAIGSCAPGPEAVGPRVTCSCGSVMLARQFAEHAGLYAEAAGSLSRWSLHGALLEEHHLPAGTAPAIVSTEAP